MFAAVETEYAFDVACEIAGTPTSVEYFSSFDFPSQEEAAEAGKRFDGRFAVTWTLTKNQQALRDALNEELANTTESYTEAHTIADDAVKDISDERAAELLRDELALVREAERIIFNRAVTDGLKHVEETVGDWPRRAFSSD
jgi:hypothetical protein